MAKKNPQNQVENQAAETVQGADTVEIVARTKSPGHPTGGINRAGLRITTEAQTFHVTPGQLAAIEADESIVIETNPKRIKQLKEDHNAGAGKTINGKEKIDGDVNTVVDEEEGDDQNENDGDGETSQSGQTDVELIKNMNKAELIAALEKKGLKKGKDFEETATNKDLKELLSVS